MLLDEMFAKKLDFISVDYLNSVPYQILEDYPGATLHFDTPARCAQLIHQRKVDWALIPLAEFLNHGGYIALPYGIVAHGAVKSVCLYSDAPLEELTEIFLDTSSRSSVILLKVILHALLGDTANKILLTRCDPDRIPERISKNTAGLIIGDASLQFSAQQHHHIIDLGTAWMKHTGLPFVFALWAARPEIVQQTDCRSLAQLIEKGIATRVTRARAWAQTYGLDLQLAENYISESIDFRIDKSAFDGMHCFAEQASLLGLLPKNAPKYLHHQLEIFPSFSRLLNQQSTKQTTALSTQQKISTTSRLNSSLETLLTTASAGKRLSIWEGIQIAENAAIADVLLASSLRRYACHNSTASLSNQDIVHYNIDWAHNPSHIPNIQNQVEYNIVGISEQELTKIIAESSQKKRHCITLRDTIQTITPISYFKSLFATLAKDPKITLYAFAPEDIPILAAANNYSVQQFITMLMEVGVTSFANPYGNTLQTSEEDCAILSVHRLAHQAGMQTTAGLLYRHEETWEERILKLYNIRQLQDETRGFCNFIAAPLAPNQSIRVEQGDISLGLLRLFAIARLFLDNISSLASPPLLHQFDIVATAIMTDTIATTYNPLIGFTRNLNVLEEDKSELLMHLELAGLEPREVAAH